jgi:hypothetical protein
MADKSNGFHFKRGLNPGFMKELKSLAKQGGWFAEVLADPDLIIGIRNNYMNVYWRGQSLFKIEWKGGDEDEDGSLEFSTHPKLEFSTQPKYLLNPELSKKVIFNGLEFQIGGNKELTTEYEANKTLDRMKRAAKLYAGDEKKGVHAIIRKNLDVIDTEVAFNSRAEEDDHQNTPRIDLACFEDVKGTIRIRFWEAKLYANPELKAIGDTEAPVVGQVRRYRKLIEKHRDEILRSYRLVARNLVEMAQWVVPERKIGGLVRQVAEVPEKEVVIDDPPIVGLLIYGFNADQKHGVVWKPHREKLESEAGMPIRSAREAKNIKLCGPVSA